MFKKRQKVSLAEYTSSINDVKSLCTSILSTHQKEIYRSLKTTKGTDQIDMYPFSGDNNNLSKGIFVSVPPMIFDNISNEALTILRRVEHMATFRVLKKNFKYFRTDVFCSASLTNRKMMCIPMPKTRKQWKNLKKFDLITKMFLDKGITMQEYNRVVQRLSVANGVCEIDLPSS